MDDEFITAEEHVDGEGYRLFGRSKMPEMDKAASGTAGPVLRLEPSQNTERMDTSKPNTAAPPSRIPADTDADHERRGNIQPRIRQRRDRIVAAQMAAFEVLQGQVTKSETALARANERHIREMVLVKEAHERAMHVISQELNAEKARADAAKKKANDKIAQLKTALEQPEQKLVDIKKKSDEAYQHAYDTRIAAEERAKGKADDDNFGGLEKRTKK